MTGINLLILLANLGVLAINLGVSLKLYTEIMKDHNMNRRAQTP